ncbi:MAG: HPP family protein [Desulfobacula sp.]|nr:HPP family protein [Desulfobacula sp.]
MIFFDKMKGGRKNSSKVNLSEIVWSWAGAFCGILSIAWLSHIFKDTDLVFIVGSFGASAVLIYGAVKSPLAQPRNLLGGHIISAAIGVATYKLSGNYLWFAAPFSVATAIAAMHATKTLHPPGGATALIAVIGSQKIHALGFYYVLMPIGVGAFIMLLIALLTNNLCKSRKYPEFWF